MDARSTLFELAARHRLDPAATRRLIALAGLDTEPPDLARALPRWIGVLAAALVGLGLVLWVAANWDALGRVAQLALVQGLVLASCLGALLVPRARAGAALLAFISIGALLALLGQTYQTGADPWQLFAWWAVLAIPLSLAVRSDALWTPWALIAITAVALWSRTHGGVPWSRHAGDLAAYPLAWVAAGLIVVWLSPALSRINGAGLWSLRTAVTLAVSLVTVTSIFGLASDSGFGQYWLGLVALGATALALALPRTFEIGSLGAVALGIDTLLVSGLARLLLDGFAGRDDPIGRLLLIGLLAAALVAGTVAALVGLARRRGEARV